MKYGKVRDGQIVKWLDIDPSDALKIDKALKKGYRPEEDIKPSHTEYERPEVSGYTILPDRLVKIYRVVSKSPEEIKRIDRDKQRLEAMRNFESDIGSINKIVDVKAYLIKLSRVVYGKFE